jgi:hypothetical protein
MDSTRQPPKAEDLLAAEGAIPEEEWVLTPIFRPLYDETALRAVKGVF